MQQKTLYILGAVVIAVGAFFLIVSYAPGQPEVAAPVVPIVPVDYKNAEYMIAGQSVRFTNGVSEIPAAPGSASKIVTRYFGNEVRHDLNADGREDVVFLVTQDTGGTGTFYYAVAALNMPEGYIGSQGLLLGDRIAPQTTEMSREAGMENVVVINYADRKPGESFTTPPSVGKSIWLKLNPTTMQFGEVVQNFEGEANPSKMTLGMKTWSWVSVTYNDGRKITPMKPGKFTLSFSNKGTFGATTDCNSMGGSYTVNKDNISFSPMMSTQRYCEGSREAEFTSLLGEAQSYHFTSKGELVIDLKFDSGSAVFK